MRKFPVTNREYLVFLNDLVLSGREEEALLYVPRVSAGQAGKLGNMIYGRRKDGCFELVADGDGDLWDLDWPVIYIDCHCAVGYAQWESKRIGFSWRLPNELEWEKSAGGVDGRFFVWGDEFDPSYCCTVQSHQEKILPFVVDSFAIDESVYGVRGMAGNMSDWTSSLWAEDWSGIDTEDPTGETGSSRVYRGGCWSYGGGSARVSFRNRNTSSYRGVGLGFRLSRTIP